MVRLLIAFFQVAMMTSTYSKESMIRGYHVYQSAWTATIGEELPCVRELSNHQDPFAVAVTNSGNIIGRLPRKISSICAMFLQKGGTVDYQVLATRCYSADLPQGGLEIPCLLKFGGNERTLKNQKLLNLKY